MNRTSFFSSLDIHLLGISCMFLGTKIEDIYHIPLQEFVDKVGHQKYTSQ